MRGANLHSPNTSSWRGAQLKKITGTNLLYHTLLVRVLQSLYVHLDTLSVISI
jgi:hypothetical protein